MKATRKGERKAQKGLDFSGKRANIKQAKHRKEEKKWKKKMHRLECELEFTREVASVFRFKVPSGRVRLSRSTRRASEFGSPRASASSETRPPHTEITSTPKRLIVS